MNPLLLLPLGFLVLGRTKRKSVRKTTFKTSGLKFSCNRIELVNKHKFKFYIKTIIQKYKNSENIRYIEDIEPLDLFRFVLKNLDRSCYKSLENKTFYPERQKFVCMILFTLIIDMLASLSLNKELFLKDYYEYEIEDIYYYLDFDDEDIEKFNYILEEFYIQCFY